MDKPVTVMSFTLLLGMLCGLSVAQISPGINYVDCGSKSIFTIQKLSVNPIPVKVGGPISVSLNLNSAEQVNGGSLLIHVTSKTKRKINIRKTVDICNLTPCPIPQGSTTLSFKRRIPIFMPRGEYNFVLKATDNNQRELFCASISVSVQ